LKAGYIIKIKEGIEIFVTKNPNLIKKEGCLRNKLFTFMVVAIIINYE